MASRTGLDRRDVYGVPRSESTGMFDCLSLRNTAITRGSLSRKLQLIRSECLDDGALFALLLGPLIASGMLHDTLRRLTAAHPHLRPRIWEIEAPLVLDSTPVRSSILYTSDTIKALSALATSRRNLVQLFTLCSFVLLVHLVRSLLLEVKLSKRVQSPSAGPASHVQPNSATLSASMERESSDTSRYADSGGTGTYWLKRGEWKRTSSAVGFACLVTLGCIGVKIVTAIIGHGVWSGECMALTFTSVGSVGSD